MRKTPFILPLVLLVAGLAGGAPTAGLAAPAAAPQSDIRVLIDVSGSMKQNDPNNLRAPALRLLTGLLPRGSRAGVWTFGRYVNMLVPYGDVDAAWKERAAQGAAAINSAGLYTNIEEALNKATWNWQAGPQDGTRRSVILLTDGLVDVSPDAHQDQAARARILDRIVPRLQRAGAVLYTIALSGESDEVLLQQMATATGGWFEQTASAADLERVFFRMFEKAADPDTLPLVANKVLVDDTIQEMTLLVFRREAAPATLLTSPDGVTFGADRLPPNVRWHSEDRYDLVTVEKPVTGEWTVNAEVDPDNRVMVVTNLRVVATRLPNELLAGDPHEFLVRLTEDNRPVEKKEFLHFMKVTVSEQAEEGAPQEWMLLDNGRDGDQAPGDGTYSLQLDGGLNPGRHELVVTVDGTTFKRVHRQTVEVVTSPVVAAIKAQPDTDDLALYVMPRADIIVPDSLQVVATISGDDGETHTRTVPRSSASEWMLPLNDYPRDSEHSVIVDVSGERPSGKPITFRTDPMSFGQAAAAETEAAQPAAPAEPVAAVAEQAPVPAAAPVTAPAEPSPPAAAETATNWWLVIVEVLLINLLLAGAGYFAYRRFGARLRRTKPWEELAHE